MENNYTEQTQISIPKQNWNRNEVARKTVDFNKAKQEQSQREFAKEHGVPRTTLQHRLSGKESLESCAELTDFFESPAGNAFIHHIF